MSGLSRKLVEHRLPIAKGKKRVKQPPKRFAPDIVLKIKEEKKKY